MTAVAAIARELSAEHPLPAVLTKVAQQACELIGFEYSAVMLADETGERLVIEGADALSSNYVQHLNSDLPILVHPPSTESDSPAARAFREIRTVALPDVNSTVELRPWRELILEQEYRAIVAAPLCAGNNPMGVLVGYSENPRKFTEAELSLVRLLADHAAIALRNARLRHTEKDMIDRLAEANAELNRQQKRADRVEKQDRKLMRLLVADVGLPGVIGSLAESLHASVVLEDPGGRVLAEALSGAHPPLPDASARSQAPLNKAIEDARKKLQVTHCALHAPNNEACPHQAWLAPVVLSGELAALLWVISTRNEPDATLGSIIERFSLMVALELLKERHSVATELRLSRDLVADLLDSQRAAPDRSLQERARALGHDLTSPHAILLFTITGASDQPEAHFPAAARLVERVARTIAGPHRTPVLAGARSDEIVALVPNSAKEDGDVPHTPPLPSVAARVRAELAQEVAPHRVTAILGDIVTRLDRYPTAYRVARGAADLTRHGSGQPVLDVANLGVWALLLESGSPQALRELADRLLGPIEEHDRIRGTTFTKTLRTWLRHDCSTPETAEALVVHPNTVTYRLGRVEQLCDLSLKKPDMLLQFHVALTIRSIEESRTGPDR
jgi:sugar diacid utilization regulator